MPTVPFCSLEDAYSDWNNKPPIQSIQSVPVYPQIQPSQEPVQNSNDSIQETTQETIKSFCPNCRGCINANNSLQQKIIDVNTWPRPRWIPQYPNSYVPYDPFNRYWMNTVPQNRIEEFGNIERFTQPHQHQSSYYTKNDPFLLQLLIFILVALFIIQLIDCIYSRYNPIPAT